MRSFVHTTDNLSHWTITIRKLSYNVLNVSNLMVIDKICAMM